MSAKDTFKDLKGLYEHLEDTNYPTRCNSTCCLLCAYEPGPSLRVTKLLPPSRLLVVVLRVLQRQKEILKTLYSIRRTPSWLYITRVVPPCSHISIRSTIRKLCRTPWARSPTLQRSQSVRRQFFTYPWHLNLTQVRL